MPVHHILFAILISLIWGVNFVVMKIGLAHLTPFLFVSLRFAIVLLFLLPWLRIKKGHMWLLFWIGICLGGLHFAFIILGLQLAENLTSIIIIIQLYVPLTLILAHFFLKERLSYWRAGGILVAFMGVLIISFDPAIVNERIAIIIIFMATLLYSIGAVLMRKLKKVEVFTTQVWSAAFGFPILFCLTFYLETGQIAQIMNMNWEGWGAIFYMSFLSSIVGYGGMNFLLRHHPVTVISPIFLSSPVFAALAAVVVFDERLTSRFLIGAGLTLSGIAVIHMRDWMNKRRVTGEIPHEI